jgi:tripartite-type tricarboxylate transporter receptor subunit TctC
MDVKTWPWGILAAGKVVKQAANHDSIEPLGLAARFAMWRLRWPAMTFRNSPMGIHHNRLSIPEVGQMCVALHWNWVGAVMFSSIAGSAVAQAAYPTKPIELIAPSQPGGGVDLVARTIGDRLSTALGQPIIVENQSDGDGVVASLNTARASPDGYTLMIGYVSTHGTKPAVRKLPYDAVKDFTPIAMVAGTPNVFVVSSALPPNTLQGFIEFAKANSGKLFYGSGGAGTLTHLAMEQFKLATNLDMVHVPYRSIGQAFVDVLGGRTQAMLPGLAAALPHIKANKVKALAVTGATRHLLLPDVPTFEELGYKGFDGLQWYGIVGPANLPAPIVKRLNDEVAKILQMPGLRERLSSEALQPMAMTPDEFGRYMEEDIANWRKLVKERHIEISD